MSSLFRDSWLALLVGILLGGGMVQTAWILLRADRTDDPGSAGESTDHPVSPRREFSHSTIAAKVSGRPGIEEKARVFAARDPQAASQWVMTLAGELQSSTAAMLLSLWASSDPQVAANWAAQFPVGETRTEAIPAIASTWAASEPEKAVAWTLSLPDSPEQRDALDDSVRTWTTLAPTALGIWVEQQPPGEATDHLRTVAAEILVDTRPQDALAMALKISDPARRDPSITRLLRQWASDDPTAARTWVARADLPLGVIDRVKIPED